MLLLYTKLLLLAIIYILFYLCWYHEGDYITLFEPVASQLEKEGKGYVVASIGQEGGYIPFTCYSAKKIYIDENPEIIQKFTNAIYKGMLWV